MSASAALLARLRMGLAIERGRPVPSTALERLLAATRRRGSVSPATPPRARSLPGAPVLDASTQLHRFGQHVRAAHRLTTHYGAWERPRDGLMPEDVPYTTKQQLVAAPRSFRSRRSTPTLLFRTSGTSGQPAAVAFESSEIDFMIHRAAISAAAFEGCTPDDHTLLATSTDGSIGTLVTVQGLALAGSSVTVTGQIAPESVLRYLVRQCSAPKPTALCAVPSWLGALVTTAESTGVSGRDTALGRISTGGEIVTSGLRRRVHAWLGEHVEIVESFGMTEVKPADGQCCEEGHLHFDPACCLVEVRSLDADRPAHPGELGTLVITPFRPFRTCTMLVRYDTGDVVRRLPVELSCSMRDVPAVSRIEGKRQFAVATDAGWVLPRDLLEAVEGVSGIPLPARASMQPSGGGVAVEIWAPSSFRAAVREAVGARFDGLGLRVTRILAVEDPCQLHQPLPMRCDRRDA